MGSVRIGPDGSIIKDGEVIETDGRTIIREDGTIDTFDSVGYSPSPNYQGYNSSPNYINTTMMPISPLENRNSSSYAYNNTNKSVDTRMLSEKEYDIQMMEGRIRGCNPKSYIIATIIMSVIAIMGLYFMFIPALVTGILMIVQLQKKKDLENQKNVMVMELDALREKYR